jgi:NAD(P)-dependent dehydrogenase (short-subunit alcohol dehydrogenase family)
MSDVQFGGATAFITGGAQGIGFGTASALAKRGTKMALVDIDKDALAAAK